MAQTNKTTVAASGTEIPVAAFIRNDQFNFIEGQTKILLSGKAASSDREVLAVLQQLAEEKVFSLFPSLTDEQKAVLKPLTDIKDAKDAEAYLEQLSLYRFPFRNVSDRELKKLFPKAKKLKGPKLEAIDFKQLSYLGWVESSTLMYLVTERDGKLEGIYGSFMPSAKKGICSICNRHSEVGLFTAKTKGSGQDHFIKRGNYICQDTESCNRTIDTLAHLHKFIGRLQK